MPDLVKISEKYYTSLVTRLGLRPPPRDGFFLESIVHPVSIVDSDITLNAVSSTQTIDTIPPNTVNSAGETTAPAANTRLATTGAQAAGNYNATILVFAAESNVFHIRRRNAADAADVWAQRLALPSANGGNGFLNFSLRFALLINEFLVVENINAGGVGVIYHATIFLNGPN